MIVHTIKNLPLSSLRPNRENPKKPMGTSYLAGLRESLKEFGFVGVVVVAPNPNGSYEILDANSRYEELAAAGVKEVPCIVLDLPTREDRRKFFLSYDKNRKEFDSERVIEQLKEMVDKGCDPKQLSVLTGVSKLERIISESKAALEAKNSAGTASPTPATFKSMVLYGPREEIEHIESLVKDVRGRMSASRKVKTIMEQAIDSMDLDDEQFLGIFLTTLAKFREVAEAI